MFEHEVCTKCAFVGLYKCMWNDGIWRFLSIFECFACVFCDYGTCRKKFYNIHGFAV